MFKEYMTEEENHLIRQYLWSVIYCQRAVLKSARSFIGTDSEWLAQHIIKYYPKRCHDSIKTLREKRDRDGYLSVANFIKAHLEGRNQTIEQYVEESKKMYCFDQSVICVIPCIMPKLVKNEIIASSPTFNCLEQQHKLYIPSFIWSLRTS